MHSSTLSHLPEHTHNSTGVSILHTPSCTCFTSWKTKFPMSYELFIGSYEQSLCRDNAITLADDYFTVRGQKSASVPHRKNRQTFLKASSLVAYSSDTLKLTWNEINRNRIKVRLQRYSISNIVSILESLKLVSHFFPSTRYCYPHISR